MKVLLIEDNELCSRAIRMMLESVGCKVTCAENGECGIAAFRKERPDLVITDIIMPEKEGLETIIDIRSVWPDGVIIAISGGGRIGNADFLQMARRLGANETLAKPFDTDDLLAAMRRCLDETSLLAAA